MHVEEIHYSSIEIGKLYVVTIHGHIGQIFECVNLGLTTGDFFPLIKSNNPTTSKTLSLNTPWKFFKIVDWIWNNPAKFELNQYVRSRYFKNKVIKINRIDCLYNIQSNKLIYFYGEDDFSNIIEEALTPYVDSMSIWKNFN